jgi:hypothetical protein
MSFDQLSIVAVERDADAINRALSEAGVESQSVPTLWQTGTEAFVTIILPITLTAVQILAAYLLVRRGEKKAEEAARQAAERHVQSIEAYPIIIKINQTLIAEDRFDRPSVEKALGKTIDDHW